MNWKIRWNGRTTYVTRERAMSAYYMEIELAQQRLKSIGLDDLYIKMPRTAPQNPEALVRRVRELRKIDPSKIKTKDVDGILKFAGTIGSPSEYLKVQERVKSKVLKGHTFILSQSFSARTANEIIKLQDEVNKVRIKNDLPPIGNLRFSKRTVDEIKEIVKNKGSVRGMNEEKERFVNNIIQSLTTAFSDVVLFGSLTETSQYELSDLIQKMYSTDLDTNYKILKKIYNKTKSGNKELYNIFSSEQTILYRSDLLEYLIAGYGVKVDIDYDVFSELSNFE